MVKVEVLGVHIMVQEAMVLQIQEVGEVVVVIFLELGGGMEEMVVQEQL